MTKLRPYASYMDSGVEWLGSVPSHWGVSKFRHCFKESSEVNGTEIVGEMLSVSGFRGVEPKVYEDENQKRDAEQLESYRVVRKGQLAVNTMWLNYSGLGISAYDGHVSPAYRAYWVTRATNLRYIHHLMRSRTYVDGYTSFLTGIRPNSLQMSRANLMEFPIVLPPRNEQDAIADFLDRETAQIDDLIGKQTRLVELLGEKRQAIITHAVTKGLDPTAPTKPSGIPWLGDIPNHWVVSQLGTWLLHHIEGGYSPTSANIYPDDEEWGVLSLGAVGRAEFHGNNVKSVDAAARVPEALAIRSGDVLLTRSNVRDRVGYVAVVGAARPRTIFPDLVYRLHLNASINDHYFVSFFSSTPARSQIESSARGSSGSMPKISHEQIRAWLMPVPPLSEQEAIVDHVRSRCIRIDDLSKRAVAAVKLLQERRAALISAAVTGKINVEVDAKDSQVA